MRKRLRVPAGVVIRGKAVGGQFVAPAGVAKLARSARKSEAASVAKLLRLAKREEARAAKRHQRAAERHAETLTTTAKRARFDRKREQDEWGRVFGVVERQAVKKPTPPKKRPPAPRRPEPPELYGYEELDAPEWEIAYEYASGGGGHSDVDVNVRVARVDGARMPKSEALAVFHELRASGGEPPDGYKLAGVRWRNPKKSSGWKSRGDPYANLANLWAPVFESQSARLLDPPSYRIGAVKMEEGEDDELDDETE